MFLEDQLVDDDDKIEKASSSVEVPVRIDSVFPHTMHTEHGGEL